MKQNSQQVKSKVWQQLSNQATEFVEIVVVMHLNAGEKLVAIALIKK